MRSMTTVACLQITLCQHHKTGELLSRHGTWVGDDQVPIYHQQGAVVAVHREREVGWLNAGYVEGTCVEECHIE